MITILKIIAWTVVVIYIAVVVLLYALQTRLIFYPGRLSKDYKFGLGPMDEELFLKTEDGETINAIFFRKQAADVILYFHGNAGDLSGWQHVAKDFTDVGFSVLIVDYRGYGKSTGEISEKGLNLDAAAAYDYLIKQGYAAQQILIYGRSIGSGIAVGLAASRSCKGLILESPFSSLTSLANEKLPLLFPSLYLRFRFNSLKKINNIKCPLLVIHGTRDVLIPPSHAKELFDKFSGRKKLVLVEGGSHNDLSAFTRYEQCLQEELRSFF